jgi:hypothetical protein
VLEHGGPQLGERATGRGELLEQDGGRGQGAGQRARGAGRAAAEGDKLVPERDEPAAKLFVGLRHVALVAAARIMTFP